MIDDQGEITESLGNSLSEEAKSQVLLSVMSLSAPETLRSIDYAVRVADDIGYDGIEIHPLRPYLLQAILARIIHPIISLHAERQIKAAHQSYRRERNIGEALHHDRPIDAVKAYSMLPRIDTSVHDLRVFNQITGKKLPIVVMPDPDSNPPIPLESRNFSQVIFQPTEELFRQMHIDMASITTPWKAALVITQIFRKTGTNGFAWDLHHGRFLADTSDEVLTEFLRHTPEVHVSLGRVDMPNDHVDEVQTMIELASMIEGMDIAHFPRLLQRIAKLGWHGRVVVEVPDSSLKQYYNEETRKPTRRGYREQRPVYHQQIVSHIRRYLHC